MSMDSQSKEGDSRPVGPARNIEQLNLRVLVADDEEMVSGLVVRMLKSMGCTVEIVKNGQEILDRLNSSQPGEFNLLITDIKMPVMYGTEALVRLRTDERFKQRFGQLPVIVCTGAHANEFEAIASEARKKAVILGKPFRMEKLAEKIKEVISSV